MELFFEKVLKGFLGLTLAISSFFQPISAGTTATTSVAVSTPKMAIMQATSTQIITPASALATNTVSTTTTTPPTPPKKTSTTSATTTPNTPKIPAKTVVVVAPPIVVNIAEAIPPQEDTVATTSPSPITFDTINANTRAAVVNILCYTQTSGPISPITGSGVIIDPRGVILTNAHIGQYYLLKDFGGQNFIECSVRTGSPAIPTYKAALLYVSPRWIDHNFDSVKRQEAKGTGEDDFAFLLITRNVNTEVPLPGSFPFIGMDVTERDATGEDVLVAGYGAGFLGGEQIQRNLFNISALAKVKEMLSYNGKTLDYLNIGGNAAAQRGSSGGAIVNSKGKLIGLIGTVTEAAQTDARELGGIALSHIDSSMIKQAGADIESFLSGSLPEKAEQFNSLVAPRLTKILIEALTTNTPARY